MRNILRKADFLSQADVCIAHIPLSKNVHCLLTCCYCQLLDNHLEGYWMFVHLEVTVAICCPKAYPIEHSVSFSFSLFKKTSFFSLGTYSVGIWWNEFLPLLVAPFTSLPHSHLGKCHLALMKSSSHWTHLNVAPRDRVTSCPLDEQEAKSTHLVRNRLPQLFFYMCDVSEVRYFYIESLLLLLSL